MIRVRFEHRVHKTGHGKDAFSTPDGMPTVPRVGEHVYLPERGGEFKVRKVVWALQGKQWVAHIDLRKPFSSEF